MPPEALPDYELDGSCGAGRIRYLHHVDTGTETECETACVGRNGAAVQSGSKCVEYLHRGIPGCRHSCLAMGVDRSGDGSAVFAGSRHTVGYMGGRCVEP